MLYWESFENKAIFIYLNFSALFLNLFVFRLLEYCYFSPSFMKYKVKPLAEITLLLDQLLVLFLIIQQIPPIMENWVRLYNWLRVTAKTWKTLKKRKRLVEKLKWTWCRNGLSHCWNGVYIVTLASTLPRRTSLRPDKPASRP